MGLDGKLRCAATWVLACMLGCAAETSSPVDELPMPLGPASGSGGTQTTQTATGPSSEAGTTTGGDEDSSESASAQSTTTSEDPGCEGGCATPPGSCYADVGTCVAGACEYAPKAAMAPCDDADGCTMVDRCDGTGTCIGDDPLTCERENAEGGTCVGGTCSGWTCVEPYENCDQDWSNGCEIPTGVPNTCNANGLGSPNACGTAYCGIEVGTNAINFMEENYRCMTCSNCASPEEGEVAWCNQATGGWYAPEPGDCPAFYEGATCNP